MRDLERAGFAESSQAYKEVKRLAYDGLGVEFSQTGKQKFRTDIKTMSREEMEQQLERVEKFLLSKSSTVTRMKKRYGKAYETWKEKKEKEGNRVKVSFDDFRNVFDNAIMKKYSDAYGSEEIERLAEQFGADGAINAVERFVSEMQKIGIYPYEVDLLKRQKFFDEFEKNKKKGS